VEFSVGKKLRHTCITSLAKSKTGPKEIQVIQFDQDVQVCVIFIIFLILRYFCAHLIMTVSLLEECLLFESMGYLYFFLLFKLFGMHFFSHAF
jgi:hypothetical protein